MATFWERAAHSVDCMFSLIFLFVFFSCFPFWFRGRKCGLIVPVSGHCLTFTFS